MLLRVLHSHLMCHVFVSLGILLDVLVGSELHPASVVNGVFSKDACCELCLNRDCLASIWRPASSACLLGGSRYPVVRGRGDEVLACVAPVRRGSPECEYHSQVDFESSRGATLMQVMSAAECCAACRAWDDCKVGLYQEKWHQCYLKAGFVSARATTKSLVACVARANPPEADEYDCTLPDAKCAARIGATHWAPCYSRNSSVPLLLDGAQSVSEMGSRVIKVALFRPKWNYALNSPDWPEDTETTLAEIASHPYFRALWDMDFDTFILVAYSTVGGLSAGNLAAGYWVGGISAAQTEEEERQFYDLSSFLLKLHPDKTFILANCEGDWEVRGGIDAKSPAAPSAFSSMVKWLAARQQGVSRARRIFKTPATRGNVYLAAEVNLVAASLWDGVANVISHVIPHVQLDMISYSAYDTQHDLSDFPAAIGYIAKQHNRTPDAPPGMRAVLVGEFGLPQTRVPVQDVSYVIANVVNAALALGVAHVIFWETYCNECLHAAAGCGRDGRCRDPAIAITDTNHLNGFWLIKPDGSWSWPRRYFGAKIGGASANVLWNLRHVGDDNLSDDAAQIQFRWHAAVALGIVFALALFTLRRRCHSNLGYTVIADGKKADSPQMIGSVHGHTEDHL